MGEDSINFEKLLREEDYHKPVRCSKCGKPLKYMGVGEYQCEACGFTEYDDYGIVRSYVEQNPGASIVQVEMNTGVSKKVIQDLVRTGRLALKGGNLN